MNTSKQDHIMLNNSIDNYSDYFLWYICDKNNKHTLQMHSSFRTDIDRYTKGTFLTKLEMKTKSHRTDLEKTNMVYHRLGNDV